MKVITVFVFAMLVVAESKMFNVHSKVHLECRKQSLATDMEFTAFFMELKEDASLELKCHFKCIMEKRGLWIRKHFHMPILKEFDPSVKFIMEYCKDRKGEDECGTAFEIAKCLRAIPPGLKGLNMY